MEKNVFEYRIGGGHHKVFDHNKFLDDFRFCLLYDVMDNIDNAGMRSISLYRNYYGEFELDIIDDHGNYINIYADKFVSIRGLDNYIKLSLYDCSTESIIATILELRNNIIKIASDL